ncbi:unnamed protein product [Staurois parvus]|uniref:Uncharacterized protein n=1 Tax=Staurois parvus TaxID=386267 RepID=A0ABN9DBM8_9NEOB|nr:unnamed protein product [Staurois parvus]
MSALVVHSEGLQLVNSQTNNIQYQGRTDHLESRALPEGRGQ